MVLVVVIPWVGSRTPRSLRFALNLGRNRGHFVDQVTGSRQLLPLARRGRAAPDRPITIIIIISDR
jgi:hypothetical protein